MEEHINRKSLETNGVVAPRVKCFMASPGTGSGGTPISPARARCPMHKTVSHKLSDNKIYESACCSVRVSSFNF